MTDQTTAHHQDSRVILANHEMALTKIEGILTATTAALGEIEPALGHLYDKADTAGDEDGKHAVMTTWGRAQQLAEHISTMSASFSGMGATMKAVIDQREAIAAELNSLVEAIDDGDWHDERLADFVHGVEEFVEESMMMYGEETAWENVYEQISDNLRSYGLQGNQADNAIALLTGDTKLTPEQLELLRTLLDSIVDEGQMS